MAFTEKLRILIDAEVKGAQAAMRGFRTSIMEADGVGGKLKAGWSSATQSIKANAGALAVGAGAALVAFGVKAVGAFTDAAKAAIDFGKATNTSTEEASRWIQVADDYEVSVGALEAAMGKVGRKGLDFIDVMETINNTAPAERSRVAFDLLGKSWQSVAPLLGKTREEYEAMLAAVSGGQVITEAEAKKAERMRLAQDALGDALESVTLLVGGLVAEIAPMIEGAAEAAEGFTELAAEAGPFLAILSDIAQVGNPFAWDTMASDLVTDVESLGNAISATVDGLDLMTVAESNAADKAEELIDAFSGAHNAATDVEDLSDAFADLIGQLDTADAVDAVADSFDDVAAAADEAWDAMVEKSPEAEKKLREQAASVRDLERDVIAFGDSVSGLPKERITEILTKIHEGDFAAAEAMFAQLVADSTKTITVKTKFDGNGNLGDKSTDGGLNPAVLSGSGGTGSYQPDINFTAQIVLDGKVISAISKKIQGNLGGTR